QDTKKEITRNSIIRFKKFLGLQVMEMLEKDRNMCIGKEMVGFLHEVFRVCQTCSELRDIFWNLLISEGIYFQDDEEEYETLEILFLQMFPKIIKRSNDDSILIRTHSERSSDFKEIYDYVFSKMEEDSSSNLSTVWV